MKTIDGVQLKIPNEMYENVAKTAVKLYVDLNITETPIEPLDIAKRKGFIVKPYSKLSDDKSSYVKNRDINGMSYYYAKIGKYVILYDDSCVSAFQRFTVMHEIGHILLGHKQESELANQMANYFAAYSLAPSPLIGLFNCADASDIMREFDVSKPCAEICIKRYMNWRDYGGELRDYEKKLLKLFK